MISFYIFTVFIVSVHTWAIAPRIECGRVASTNLIHQNPWLVYLEYYRGDQTLEVRCAATLVDSRHLITAAHCVRTPKFTRLEARLGEYDLTSELDCVDGVCADHPVIIEVEDIVVHQDYDEKENDIAVLRLAVDAPYTDFIRPICLPTGHLQPDAIFEASGWGEIPGTHHYSTLKKVILLPFWEKESCMAAYKKINIPANVICAGGESGIDTCSGDSGGPLVWDQNRMELWGVTSSGIRHCGKKKSPGFYTNVAVYLEWIKMVLDKTWDRLRENNEV